MNSLSKEPVGKTSMSGKKRKAEESVRTYCPECETDTDHVEAPSQNGGGIRRVKCLTCEKTHTIEEDAAADTDEVDAEVDDAEELEGEHAADAAAGDPAEADDDGAMIAEDKAEEEAEDAEDGDEDADPRLSAIRGRLMSAPEEDAEEEDDEEEASEPGYEDEDARGLSSFGRSSFEEGAVVSDDDDDEAAPRKRKKAVRKKPVTHRAAGGSQSWDEVMSQVDEKKARSYDLRDTYRAEEIIQHAKFGVGKVVEVVSASKISVLFKEGRKMMLQGRR
jgi:hypothetical protein